MRSPGKIPKRDRERIDSFLHCYNEIDAELRRRLRKEKRTSFASLIREFERSGGSRQDGDLLERAGALRNFVVHEPKKEHDCCAVPTELLVLQFRQLRDQLLDPEKVTPRFAKRVETISPDHTLTHVLRQIARRDFSQFPVYQADKFKGLLTENGITRWLSKHVERTFSLVELEEVYVSELLREEELRDNCHFVHGKVTIEEARRMFREHGALEAVLITENGQRTEPPLGIVTRWDMLH